MSAPQTEADDMRPVRMSALLMGAIVVRDFQGNLLRWDWGQPGGDGFYSPTITVDTTDNVAREATHAALAAVRGRIRGLRGYPYGSDPLGWTADPATGYYLRWLDVERAILADLDKEP